MRCTGGTLTWLYLEAAPGGGFIVPDLGAGEPSVSARSVSRGDSIQAGERRYYAVQHRDPIVLGECSSASTFNMPRSLRVECLR